MLDLPPGGIERVFQCSETMVKGAERIFVGFVGVRNRCQLDYYLWFDF